MKVFRLIENIEGRLPMGFGMGAGRWNLYGTPTIYCCNVSSLNFLELLSIKGPVVSKSDWILVTLEIIDDIPFLDPTELPQEWKRRPFPTSTQQLGTEWSKGMISPILKVPSSQIPLSNYSEEFNLLINPHHPEFHQSVNLIKTEDVSFKVNY